MWFRVSAEGRREFAHHTDPNQISMSYRGRTRYIGGSYSSCSVQIRGVKLSDAGQYHFRFETDQPLGRWTSPDTITLDVTDLQVQVHPARPGNMFGFGETVFVGCRARGCAAPGKSLALYRNGLNLGSFEEWMTINRFDSSRQGIHCRPNPAAEHSPRSTSIAAFPAGELSEGGSVTLTCSSDAAPPVESFAWFKDMESGSIPDSFSPQLHLSYLKYTDRGEYYCVARNSLGTDRSGSLFLNVTYSPKNTHVWVSPRRDIREGSFVHLSCLSHSYPPPSRYAWYRVVGEQLVAKGNFQNLTFPSVGAQHAGQYYCIASNPLGSQASLVSSLTVLYPPKNTSIVARPSSVVDAGRPLTLTCSSQAYPAVDNFTWHRLALDGATAAWATKSGPVFAFSEVGPGETGQYYCEARNPIGAHSSPVLTVRVRGRLKVIALASAVGVSAGLITLTVAVMISKNMHRVDAEPVENVNKVEPSLSLF
ncbi:B-cell receptor CD22-like [Fundulus heteroclitus]|uniref:B-cell receptor CD22-like n=1 Tax=Fundulus heteroclitus TaxID=8078 RepID=UPI00165A31D8|nr:B-cell receptor CD22-like [Fundulus heteroclitus]